MMTPTKPPRKTMPPDQLSGSILTHLAAAEGGTLTRNDLSNRLRPRPWAAELDAALADLDERWLVSVERVTRVHVGRYGQRQPYEVTVVSLTEMGWEAVGERGRSGLSCPADVRGIRRR